MIGLERVSAQALSDTIGAIYDCALDPQRWLDAIRRIVDLLESAAGGMCVHDLRNTQNVHLFEVGYSREFSETFQLHYERSPIAAASIVGNIGDVQTLAMMTPDDELLESRFYHQALKPFGLRDFIGFQALRTDGRIASIHASRMEQAPRYSEREFGLLKLLAPHVCRTVAISDALDIKTLNSAMLEATLNGLAAGVYLLARDSRVVYMNAAAERQIKTGNALRVAGNRLIPTDPQARTELAKAVDDLAKDETETRGNHSIAIPDAGGAGCVATLLPLECGERRNVIAPFAASVAVFVQVSAQIPMMPGEAFAKLYGLTGGEWRVLLALAQGLGGKEAADMLGIGEPTVRTHLQRIFSKTATSRQAELLQLLQGSAPPTKAA
jgi:DNA-binding CsgD family transcriptional regulator/PAS domain-containing protein